MIKPRESKKTLFTFHCSNSNMTSLVEHSELRPTVLRFLPKELKPENTVLGGKQVNMLSSTKDAICQGCHEK